MRRLLATSHRQSVAVIAGNETPPARSNDSNHRVRRRMSVVSSRGGSATLSHFWAVGETCQPHQKRDVCDGPDASIVAGTDRDNRGLTFREKDHLRLKECLQSPGTALRASDPVVEPFPKGQTIFRIWCDNAPAQPRGPKSPDLSVARRRKRALPAAGHGRKGTAMVPMGDGRNHRWMWLSGRALPQRESCLICLSISHIKR